MRCRVGAAVYTESQINTVNVARRVIRVRPIEHVRSKVNELIQAWSRPPPRVDASTEGGPDKGRRAAGGGSGGDNFQEGQGTSGRKRKRKRGDDLGGLAPKWLLRDASTGGKW